MTNTSPEITHTHIASLEDVHGTIEVKDGHSTTGSGPANQSGSRTGPGGLRLAARSPCCHDDGNQVLAVRSVSRRQCAEEEYG